MSTQIIKLNSLKHSIQSLFQNIKSKFKSKENYDITVIMQHNQTSKNTSDVEIGFESEPSQHNKKSEASLHNKEAILNNSLDQSISLEDSIENNNVCFQTEKNLQFSSLKQITNMSRGKNRISKQEKENIYHQVKHSPLKHQMINNSVQTDPQSDKLKLNNAIKFEDSLNVDLDLYSVKLNNEDICSENTQTERSQEEDGDSDAGFLIQNHLNQALQLIDKDRMLDLEDFLYKYQEKYSFINIRTQTKWRLLMAHCKQSKLQFQRAATNYNQVIAALKECPEMMTVDLADVYNRLGLCYFQIRQWNKGITAYSEALNFYKTSKRSIEYANCITNLGILYLEVGYFLEAQKCLLIAYNIRRQNDRKNPLSLVPTLFHLFDCNLNIKNYIQSQSILSKINEMLIDVKSNQNIYKITYCIKRAKLEFFLGDFDTTFQNCQEAIQMLGKINAEPQFYGEVLELMGLLKSEKKEYAKSKVYFEKALKAIQNYVPADSIKLLILKNRIQNLIGVTGHSIKEKAGGVLVHKRREKQANSVVFSQNDVIISAQNNEEEQ